MPEENFINDDGAVEIPLSDEELKISGLDETQIQELRASENAPAQEAKNENTGDPAENNTASDNADDKSQGDNGDKEETENAENDSERKKTSSEEGETSQEELDKKAEIERQESLNKLLGIEPNQEDSNKTEELSETERERLERLEAERTGEEELKAIDSATSHLSPEEYKIIEETLAKAVSPESKLYDSLLSAEGMTPIQRASFIVTTAEKFHAQELEAFRKAKTQEIIDSKIKEDSSRKELKEIGSLKGGRNAVNSAPAAGSLDDFKKGVNGDSEAADRFIGSALEPDEAEQEYLRSQGLL